MPKFQVTVERVETYVIEVEAEHRGQAEDAAYAEVTGDVDFLPDTVTVEEIRPQGVEWRVA